MRPTRLTRLTAFLAERLARHSLARHRVSQGLPDERPGEHDAGDADGRRRRSASGTACGTSMPATCPGRVGDLEHTRCHNCGAPLVERYGYFIQGYRLTPDGACPECGTSIPGRWGASFDGQITVHAVPARAAALADVVRLRADYLPARISSTAILNASYGCAPSTTLATVILESPDVAAEQEHRRAVDIQLGDPLDARLDFLRMLARLQAGAERVRVQPGVLGDAGQLLGGLQRRFEQLLVQVPELALIVARRRPPRATCTRRDAAARSDSARTRGEPCRCPRARNRSAAASAARGGGRTDSDSRRSRSA